MISKVKLAGKYLDQPLLISKFKTAVTPVFIGGSALYGAHEIYKAPKEERKKTAINITSIMTATVASALAAPKISAKLVGKEYEKYSAKVIKKKNTEIVNDFIYCINPPFQFFPVFLFPCKRSKEQ